MNQAKPIDIDNAADLLRQYQNLIEFGLLVILFFAVAHSAMRHRFPGRAGTAISAVIAVALAGSLTAALERWKVSLLDSSWPVVVLGLAATILIVRLRLPVLFRTSTGTPGPADSGRALTGLTAGTQAGLRDNDRVLGQLEALSRAIRRTEPGSHDLQSVRQELRRLLEVSQVMNARLKTLPKSARRLELTEARDYARLARRPRNRGSSAEITHRAERLRQEDRMRHLARVAARRAKHFRRALNKADLCLCSKKPYRAQRWMTDALRHGRRLTAALSELSVLEQRLARDNG